MQTLGVLDSTPRSESRLKSLFWPDIESGYDVEYLGSQGFWICTFVAIVSTLVLVVGGQVWTPLATFLFFFLGGFGVRERDRYAAIIVCFVYALNMVISINVMQVFFTAILLSNVRATWIASTWKPGTEDAERPPRMSGTFGEKLSDQLPMWLWPKMRIVFYILSVLYAMLIMLGLSVMAYQGRLGVRPR